MVYAVARHPQRASVPSGSSVVNAIGRFNGKLRDEVLNREIFYTLGEAKILIERWRQEYNMIRRHSLLGYRSPAPEAALWQAPGAPALPLETVFGLT
jgi:integrase-like protein